MLHRMRDGEDPLVFIEAFQATAVACHWPEEERAARLLPLLSGEAQTAALSLPPGSQGVFEDVCWVVLDCLGLSPEDYRQQFWASRMTGGERPFGWARQLEDTAARWLRPGPSAGEARLLNLIVLKQFVGGLPEAMARWVRCHRPADLTAAIIWRPTRDPALRSCGGAPVVTAEGRQPCENGAPGTRSGRCCPPEPQRPPRLPRSHGELHRRRGRTAGSVGGWGTCA